MAKMKLNVKLLRKIQRHILAEPRRYDQNAIFTRGLTPGDIYEEGHVVPSCGTIACIGGWAGALSKQKRPTDWNNYENTLRFAQRVLRLDDRQATRLFAGTGGGWPERFDTAYEKAKTPRGRALVAVRRIDHFIKTKGQE